MAKKKMKRCLLTITFETSGDASGLVEDVIQDLDCMDNTRVVKHLWEELWTKESD